MWNRVRIFTSPRDRRSALYFLAVVCLWLVLASALVVRYAPGLADPDGIRAVVDRFGPAAPLAFVLLQAAQVVFAPIPGQVVAFAGGYLFGPVWGTVYSVIGATLGSYVVFRLSRRFGRPYVDRIVEPAALARFDAAVDEAGAYALLVVFLVPGLPDDVVCFAAGLTNIDLRTFLAVSVVGRLPGYLLVTVAGADLAAARPDRALGLLAAIGLLSLLGYVVRDRLLRWLSRRG